MKRKDPERGDGHQWSYGLRLMGERFGVKPPYVMFDPTKDAYTGNGLGDGIHGYSDGGGIGQPEDDPVYERPWTHYACLTTTLFPYGSIERSDTAFATALLTAQAYGAIK